MGSTHAVNCNRPQGAGTRLTTWLCENSPTCRIHEQNSKHHRSRSNSTEDRGMIQLSTVAAFLDDHGLQAIGLLFVWASLLLLFAWIIAGFLRRASSAVRYCVWQFALMGLLVLPAVFAVLPGIPLGPALTATER